MYKLLIVDDEDVEREGMARFIRWEDYGIQLSGTAWNGVEGYEEIQNHMPDIVITDIRMPVMNGIELIRKTREDFPDIVFIVLSGYGEYEYTSRAMELGVRHYILKPCDEAKILEVIGKVRTELLQREEKKKAEDAIRSQVKRLAPRAREQMFRNVLQNREDLNKMLESHLIERNKQSSEVFLLAFHKEKWFDYLEQFVVSNIMTEVVGSSHVILVTSIRTEVLFLLDADIYKEISPAIEKVKKEYMKFDVDPVKAVVSGCGSWTDIHSLYEQVSGLLKSELIEGGQDLWRGFYKDLNRDELMLINYRAIRNADSYDLVLRELYLGLVKMRLRGDSREYREMAFVYAMNMLEQDDCHQAWFKECGFTDDVEMMKGMTDYICRRLKIGGPGGKEEARMRDILAGIYENIKNPELNIQWLVREVLYMNEDYFGRLFSRCMNMRYSAYVLNVRIELAKRLIWYFTDIKLAQIAEEVGYPADGQYFSKVFRKAVGMSPSEYKEHIQNNQ